MPARVVPKEGLAREAFSHRAHGVKTRAVFASSMRLVEILNPDYWEKVRWCRYNRSASQHSQDRAKFKVVPMSCKKVPYCVLCTQDADKWRGLEWRDRFWRCTPVGQPIRAIHVVMGTPTVANGEGWGWEARKDLHQFRTWGERVLRAVFGEGIGGVSGYQDFGEQHIFDKPFPHLDVVLNGFAVRDGKAVRLEAPQLGVGGKRSIYNISKKIAEPMFRGVRTGSNIWVGKVLDSSAQVFQATKYALREMIDYRDFSYREEKDEVFHKNYRDQTYTRTNLEGFRVWMREYNHRFRPERLLPADATKEHRSRVKKVHLVRGFGHMAPNKIKGTMELFGSNAPPHRRGCLCSECVTWERVVIDRAGNLVTAPDGSAVPA